MKKTGIHAIRRGTPGRQSLKSWPLAAILAALMLAVAAAPTVAGSPHSAFYSTENNRIFDAVRIGIALYGLRPSAEAEPAVPLRPALTLKSRVGRVQTLPGGSSISYGRTFITRGSTPVALVPIGYGDGYLRLNSNRGAVLVHGQRAPIRGRVCMDQLVVEISGIEGVQVDDEVVLIGRQGDQVLSAEEVAGWGETINYEVVTQLMPRVPRVYLSGGEIVSIKRDDGHPLLI